MKKSLILFSLITILSGNLTVNAASTTGKFDEKNKETYSEYLKRKSSITENVTGKFTTHSIGTKANTLTFSQAHIFCTNEEKMFVDSGSTCSSDNCTAGSSGGDMKVDRYNSCMGEYAPFKDEQEGVDSCAAETIEWGEYGTGNTCSADLAEIPEFQDSTGTAIDVSEGSSVLVQNQNTTDSFQGFAKVICESGTITILDSKCTLVPDPCEADIKIARSEPPKLIPTVSPPINSVNSSLTNFTINCPGFNVVNTSCPKAFCCTLLVKSLAILKLTSASNKALRTSFSVSATLTSVIFPCPLSVCNALSNFSLKLLNMYRLHF